MTIRKVCSTHAACSSVLLLLIAWLVEATPASAETLPEKPLPRLELPGSNFKVAGRAAFIFAPPESKKTTPQPWIFYAPTLPGNPDLHEQWMHEQFVAAGVAVAGIDVGESFGSPQGRAIFDEFYRKLVDEQDFAARPCLFARSRGGLWCCSWAADHPDRVAGIIGIYPAFDLTTYPGVEIAAPVYGLTAKELQLQLPTHNPINRVPLLAKAMIPAMFIHGDRDEVVPMRANSGRFLQCYKENGADGIASLIVCHDQGHSYWQKYFRNQELVDHAIKWARAGTAPRERKSDSTPGIRSRGDR